MKSTSDHPNPSGLSLERPETERSDMSAQEQELLDAARKGLRARQAEPHLGNLLSLIERPDASPTAKGNACLLLTDYYRDVFGILQNRPDPDRATYYAQRAIDCGLKVEGACALAMIRLALGDVEGAIPNLLKAIRADYGPVFPILLHPATQEMFLQDPDQIGPTLPFGDPNHRSDTKDNIHRWYWGPLYLAMRRWAVHPDNQDAFSRQEAQDKATLLLRTVKDNPYLLNPWMSSDGDSNSYIRSCKKILLLKFFKAQYAIALEAKAAGEDGKLLSELSKNYSLAYERPSCRSPISAGFFLASPVLCGVLISLFRNLLQTNTTSYVLYMLLPLYAAGAITLLVAMLFRRYEYSELPASAHMRAWVYSLIGLPVAVTAAWVMLPNFSSLIVDIYVFLAAWIMSWIPKEMKTLPKEGP